MKLFKEYTDDGQISYQACSGIRPSRYLIPLLLLLLASYSSSLMKKEKVVDTSERGVRKRKSKHKVLILHSFEDLRFFYLFSRSADFLHLIEKEQDMHAHYNLSTLAC